MSLADSLKIQTQNSAFILRAPYMQLKSVYIYEEMEVHSAHTCCIVTYISHLRKRQFAIVRNTLHVDSR